jgi:hypothetical protein
MNRLLLSDLIPFAAVMVVFVVVILRQFTIEQRFSFLVSKYTKLLVSKYAKLAAQIDILKTRCIGYDAWFTENAEVLIRHEKNFTQLRESRDIVFKRLEALEAINDKAALAEIAATVKKKVKHAKR